MKREFSCLAALILLVPGYSVDAIAGDSASSQITIQGTAQEVCRMSSPEATNLGNASMVETKIEVNELIDANDATLKAWNATLNFGMTMCNYGATLSLQSKNGGLQLKGTAQQQVGGNFLDSVNYVARAKWGNLTELVLDTAIDGTSPVSVAASGPNQADLVVSLTSPGSNSPGVSGTYDDVLVIKVGPSI